MRLIVIITSAWLMALTYGGAAGAQERALEGDIKAQRAAAARSLSWRTMTGFWEGDGLIHLGAGTVSKQEMEVTYRDNPSGLVDRIVALMRLKLAPSTLSALKTYASRVSWWQRVDLIVLILLTPDVNVA